MATRKTSPEEQKILHQFKYVGIASILLVGTGMVFYHMVEDLDWIDAAYFCVITLTTTGFGDITPKTDIGKVFTIFYLLFGIGIIATFANLAVKRAVIKHRQKD